MTEELKRKLDLMEKFKELNVTEYKIKYGDYYGLMFAGAEIVTKELQEEIEELKKDSDIYQEEKGNYKALWLKEVKKKILNKKKIKQLEKLLTEQYPDLKQSLDWAYEREKELLEQIEKMKCCENCRHYDKDLGCQMVLKRCSYFSEWELVE